MRTVLQVDEKANASVCESAATSAITSWRISLGRVRIGARFTGSSTGGDNGNSVGMLNATNICFFSGGGCAISTGKATVSTRVSVAAVSSGVVVGTGRLRFKDIVQ